MIDNNAIAAYQLYKVGRLSYQEVLGIQEKGRVSVAAADARSEH